MSNTIFYRVLDADDNQYCELQLINNYDIHLPQDLNEIAEECAQHFYENFSPAKLESLQICLHENKDESEIGRFFVTPYFSAELMLSEQAKDE